MNLSIQLGWGARLAVLLLSFVNIRLLIGCVGAEGLAAYSIVISLTPWLALMNLGLPITIQNVISRLRGNQVEHHINQNQAFGAMFIITIVMAPIAIAVGWLTCKLMLFNYPMVSQSAVIGAVIFIYIAGQGQMLVQVLYAEHKATWPNVYPLLVALWVTAVLTIASQFNVENFNFLLILVSLSNLVVPIHAGLKLKVLNRVQLDFRETYKLVLDSKDQLYFSILASVTLSVDYLIMSRTLDALDVVNYNLTSKLFMTLLVIHGVLLASNWTPVADLMHSAKNDEARKKIEKVLKQGLAIGLVAGLVLLVCINLIVGLVTGEVVEAIPLGLSLAVWVYVLLRIWTDTYAMALQGYGMVSEINKFLPIQAVLSAISQYYLANLFGAEGIVLGMILSFALTASWIIPKKFYSLMSS